MRNLFKILISLSAMLLFSNHELALADNNPIYIPDSDSCGDIVNNYLDAAGEFASVLQTMIPLSNEKDVTEALNDAANGINNNNITYNAMQSYDGSISGELKKHPNPALNEGMSSLNSQLGSMHTRVVQWKSTGCREKHACDLGEPGYCSDKHDN